MYHGNHEAFLNSILIKWNLNEINDQELFEVISQEGVHLGARTVEVLICFAKTALGYNLNAEELKNMDSFEKSQFNSEEKTILKLMVHTKAYRR